MMCQHCGRNDALIHLTEINDGQVQSLWLCPACAREHKNQRAARGVGGPSDGGLPENGDPFALPPRRERGRGPDQSLADFLGEDGLLHRNVDPDGVHTCPVCGYTIESFFRTERLGCAGCYRAFEPNIRPLLARHHGRTIHLGKVPRSDASRPNLLADRTRVRVALERAVAREDFEEAARLRDQLKALPGPEGPGSPDGGESHE